MAPVWPNFFIVGAARAGTTSLYEYLRPIDKVYLSPVKEPRYFCAAAEPPGYAPPAIRSETEYLKLFSAVQDQAAVGEASPQYLCDPGAPEAIHAAVPEARIVMILRDPVERAYSHYLLHQRMGVQQRPAATALKDDLYLRHGRYAGPVKNYRRLFGASRVKALIFDDFVRDTRGSVRAVLRFLGIDAQPASTSEIHNAYGRPRGPLRRLIYQNMLLKTAGRRWFSDRLRRKAREEIFLGKDAKPPLPQEIRTFLEEFYRADVLELEEILGCNLPWFHARAARRAP
jgi:Sulfotransferase family